MGAFHLFEDVSLSLKEIFSDMPSSVRSLMTRGFTALGSLSAEQLDLLSRRVTDNVNSFADMDVEDLSSVLGVPEETTGTIVSATTLLIALVTTRNETADVVVQELADAQLIPEKGSVAALQLARFLYRDRDGLKRSMRLGSLATRTLPSFKSLHTSVDLRLEFNNDAVDIVVPTVVAHLVTDDGGSDTFFQMSKADVFKLVEQLSRVAADIKTAEVWSKGAR